MDEPFEDEIATGDRRRSLVALRAYLAHELAGNRCRTCQMSGLRDTAAIVLRLTKVMEELEAMPDADGEVSDLDRIRKSRGSDTPDNLRLLGSKNAQRRQGGRRPSG